MPAHARGKLKNLYAVIRLPLITAGVRLISERYVVGDGVAAPLDERRAARRRNTAVRTGALGMCDSRATCRATRHDGSGLQTGAELMHPVKKINTLLLSREFFWYLKMYFLQQIS